MARTPWRLPVVVLADRNGLLTSGWVHHMFPTGIPTFARLLFRGEHGGHDPSVIQVFACIATLAAAPAPAPPRSSCWLSVIFGSAADTVVRLASSP